MADILVVDDNPHHLSFVGMCVERAGHQCSLLQDGRQCLAAVERRIPDLIITDISMPELDGLELISALRDGWPAMPIIGMTGGCRGVIRPYMDFFPLFFGSCAADKTVYRERLVRGHRSSVGR